MVYEELFPARLTALRMKAGVSARDMSLSIGQNAGYIHSIESGKTLPSMSTFFYICEYLKITPSEFFEMDNDYPSELDYLITNLKKLNKEHLLSISNIVCGLVE